MSIPQPPIDPPEPPTCSSCGEPLDEEELEEGFRLCGPCQYAIEASADRLRDEGLLG